MAGSDNLDERRAVDHLMALLAIPGLSGEEGAIAAEVRRRLLAAGCRADWIRHDRAHERIPGDYQVGNLVVLLPGTRPGRRRLFMAHLDTVPLCRGARPVLEGGRIRSAGPTGVGADDRTGVAALVTMTEHLLEKELPHPPLTLLLTVGEERGLAGSRSVEVDRLGDPGLGFNIDSSRPERLIVGAVGAERWNVDVGGRSAHAAVHPEDGVSAILIASRAIERAAAEGWFGRPVRGEHRGTANVGVIRGGEATNQVAHQVFVRGESRSDDPDFMAQITAAYRKAFEAAAESVRAADGTAGTIEFQATTDYRAFELAPAEPVVRFARRVVASLGLEPVLETATGGLDANQMVAHGIPTVTFGAGQHGAHTVDEYVDVSEYLRGCRLALALATAPE